MGIFGFGALRDRFTSIVPAGTIVRGCYVACFDITPIVVYAIRNSTSEAEFLDIFHRHMDNCREIRFLRNNPPYALCYTLDNRAPQAKRQTQLQRLADAHSVVARITTVPHGLSGSRNAKMKILNSPVRICDVVHRIREIVLRDYLLTDTSSSSSSSSSSYRSSKTNTNVAQTFVDANHVEFDYNEGEGEIKAINWLSTYRDRPRLIMARDNDVFVYILSKLSETHSTASVVTRKDAGATTVATSGNGNNNYYESGSSPFDTLSSWRDRQHSAASLRSGGVRTMSHHSPRHDADAEYLVYHESSNNVLRCWTHLGQYYNKCWVLLLWFSICFGNDFAFGILNKSISTMRHYYPLLERHFVNISNSIVSVTVAETVAETAAGSDRCCKSDNRYSETILLQQFDDTGVCEEVDAETTIAYANVTCDEKLIRSLTRAFCELQNILSSPYSQNTTIAPPIITKWPATTGENSERDATAVTLANLARWMIKQSDTTNKFLRKSFYGDNHDDDDDDDDDDKEEDEYDVTTMRRINEDHTRLWIARQLWSLFYILELPSEFTRDQCFRHCPNLRINATFDKPFLSIENFLQLNENDFSRHIQSIVTRGI